MGKLLDQNTIISRFMKKYEDKYDYSKFTYINSTTKSCIICPEHGEFWMSYKSHINGHECPKCTKIKGKKFNISNTREFIDLANNVHNNKYDYSKVIFTNLTNKVCIICPIHGEFWQGARVHLEHHGCPYCNKGIKYSKDLFVKLAQTVHNNKYNYDKVNYINNYTKITITCPIHGDFNLIPHKHLTGTGCPQCLGFCRDTQSFIIKSNLVHNYRYIYDKVNYVSAKTPVCITCRIHGDFWQKPDKHIHGHGCPHCHMSRNEYIISEIFKNYNIKYIREWSPNWLGKQKLDFYLPDYNVAIEYNGPQHYMPVDFAGRGISWANNHFKTVIERDNNKLQLCQKHNLPIYVIPYIENIYIIMKYIIHEITN